ncbi:43050_t:CDS:1, partial [Gigaspora margarita]
KNNDENSEENTPNTKEINEKKPRESPKQQEIHVTPRLTPRNDKFTRIKHKTMTKSPERTYQK